MVMLSHMRVMKACASLGVVLAVTSCTHGSSTATLADRYAVAWRMEPAQYNPAAVEAAITRCASLPGASRGSSEPAVLPPISQVVFSGSTAQRHRLEACLLSLKPAVIYGPSHGEAHAPVLYG